MAIFHEDMVNIELKGGNVFRTFVNNTVGGGDADANKFGVRAYRNGTAEPLNGTVTGYFVRADGETVVINDGVVSGNEAYVMLPESCYAVEGNFTLSIKITNDGDTSTLRIVDGTVSRTSTDAIVDPGTLVASIDDLIEAIEDAVETIPEDYSSLQANTFNYLAAQATAVTSSTDLNNYKTPGNYYVQNASVAATVSHYPFSIGGRILIFQTTNSSVVVQLCIPNNSSAPQWRIFNSSWSDWQTIFTKAAFDAALPVQAKGTASGAGISDLDDAPVNTIIGYTAADISGLANFPGWITSGGLIVTLNYANQQNGKVQFVIPWAAGAAHAVRYYQSGWKAWESEDGVTVLKVGSGSGDDFDNLVDALDYATSDTLRDTWNEHNRLVIEVDAGTFSMNKIATLYGSDSTRYKWGVYIPRYCTVRGKGKGRTILTYDYSGTDDWILGHLSPLNMPYESALEDLTITTQNCRYCVHSDGDEPFSRSAALSDNRITVRNVRMVHNGYSGGNSPTYNVPSAWGQGFRDGCVREFINCEFIASHMPWFTHDTTGQARPSEMIFRGCVFVNKKNASFTSNGEYAGPTFISWGTGIRNAVTLENCHTNRYICIRGVSTYVAGTTCDYYVRDDGGNMVLEGNLNNAHLLDNWINGNCVAACAGAAVTGYKPVTVDPDGYAGAYSSSGYRHGIALFSCSSGDDVIVQVKGLVALARLGVSGFSAGATVGWNGSAWAADSTHPILKVIDANMGDII